MKLSEYAQFCLAYDVARKGHYHEKRRDGVTPYLVHLQQVQQNVRKRNNDEINFIEESVALLHDIAENFKYTKLTLQDLRDKGFSDTVVDAVDALTHRDGETYDESILRAKANPIARKVKIADNLANLSDTPTNKQILKYAKSLQVLLAD